MTVDEFCQRCDEILVEREATLKIWQVYDIRLYKRLVKEKGVVLPLDEYYLTFVGVPYTGRVTRPVKRVGAKMNAKPQKLF